MAKKIRFPLKMRQGVEIRTLEELREHFDLQSVLEYYKNGKLLTWLEDRYLEGEAEAVRALDESSPDFQKRLCEVFQVAYTGNEVDLEELQYRQERLKHLRTVTDEDEFIQNIDRVAFDQEELADLLDEDTKTIYLCGENFTIPASRKGIAYIGINTPVVHISGKIPEKLEELDIQFTGIQCDNLLTIKEDTSPKTEAVSFKNGNFSDISESVADIIYQKVKSSNFEIVETDHYILYKYDGRWAFFGRSEGDQDQEGIYVINKVDGSISLLVAKSAYPDQCIRDFSKWAHFEDTIIAFFSKENIGLADTYMIDIPTKEIKSLNFQSDLSYLTITNRKYYVVGAYGGKLTCVDLERRKKYSITHNCCWGSNRNVICTEESLYFVADRLNKSHDIIYQLVEFSFATKKEQALTEIPNNSYSIEMAYHNNKIFMLLNTGIHSGYSEYEIGYVDLSCNEYRSVCRNVCLRRMGSGKAHIEKYHSGWIFVTNDSKYSLEMFDFQTMEQSKLAERCGYDHWYKGGFFERGCDLPRINPFVIIGEWVYYEQGEEETDAKVSLQNPMDIEILGNDL